jgi:hypothetical protein
VKNTFARTFARFARTLPTPLVCLNCRTWLAAWNRLSIAIHLLVLFLIFYRANVGDESGSRVFIFFYDLSCLPWKD